jgi:hypothetical protein
MPKQSPWKWEKLVCCVLRLRLRGFGQLVILHSTIVRDARLEIERCAKFAFYYAENGRKFLENIPVKTDAGKQDLLATSCHKFSLNFFVL